MDVVGEVMPDGGGGDGDARGPLFDELVDVKQAMIARGFEVFGELSGSDARWAESVRAHGPDGSYPG